MREKAFTREWEKIYGYYSLRNYPIVIDSFYYPIVIDSFWMFDCQIVSCSISVLLVN